LIIEAVWSRKGENVLHHWGDVFEGKIFVPGRKFVRIPNVTSESFLSMSFANCGPGDSVSETIEIFDWEDGSYLQSIELLPILSNVEFPLFRQFLNNCADPIHLNDVVIVKLESHAKLFPEGQVGDLLISMREINTIEQLDRNTHKVKWRSSLFARQHNPRITDYGTIIVFDNLASSVDNGRSRYNRGRYCGEFNRWNLGGNGRRFLG